jgi:hypothetical protein
MEEQRSSFGLLAFEVLAREKRGAGSRTAKASVPAGGRGRQKVATTKESAGLKPGITKAQETEKQETSIRVAGVGRSVPRIFWCRGRGR